MPAPPRASTRNFGFSAKYRPVDTWPINREDGHKEKLYDLDRPDSSNESCCEDSSKRDQTSAGLLEVRNTFCNVERQNTKLPVLTNPHARASTYCEQVPIFLAISRLTTIR